MLMQHNLLPKHKHRKNGLNVNIDLYELATELYNELDTLGVIERTRKIPQLGLIRVTRNLSKTRYDYIMLQLYFHQLIKPKLSPVLKLSYNNYLSQNDFLQNTITFSGKKITIADIMQIMSIIYNIGHFKNTFTSSRAIVMLFCPMSGGASDYFRRNSYTAEIDRYIDYIKTSYNSKDPKQANSYLTNGGWNARNNGRDLAQNPFRCIENVTNKNITITVIEPTTDWQEWMKTIGPVLKTESGYSVKFEDQYIDFSLTETDKGYIVSIPESISKDNPKFSKLFRQVFRKAAYCGACRVCETNCRKGCISFIDGKVKIENCINCHQCHDIDSGCLLFHSLRHPQGGGKPMKSLNSFADHAPKRDWLVSFFDLKEDFFTEHSLGPMMYDMFRRFLRDAGLNDKNHFTPFAELISEIGWETDTALGLMLVNLAMENPQIAWYINNFELGYYYERTNVEEMLTALDVKPKDAKSIVKAYKRITDTPFGTTLNFGYVTDEDDLVRSKCNMSDARVLLYALYKFAEKCNDYKEFHLSYLYDESVERDGISPVRIFGLTDEEELKSLLLGLSAQYPEFINATFTNDLQTITLRDKTSEDVLDLFREDI